MIFISGLKKITENVGEFIIFTGHAFGSSGELWKRRSLFWRHCEFIGVTSAGIVGISGLFMGAVLGYQLYTGFHRFGAESLVGGTIGISIFRELGPVMAAIMVAGRAGAAIAAEISSMKISEQIDALEIMAVNPFEYLVTPRVYAAILMMPILSVLFAVVGSLSAAFIACYVMDLSWASFITQYLLWTDPDDILTHCCTKSLVFGCVIAIVSCFFGFRAKGGAAGVGLATRSTVVVSCLGILFTDYFLTSFLPFGWTYLRLS